MGASGKLCFLNFLDKTALRPNANKMYLVEKDVENERWVFISYSGFYIQFLDRNNPIHILWLIESSK